MTKYAAQVNFKIIQDAQFEVLVEATCEAVARGKIADWMFSLKRPNFYSLEGIYLVEVDDPNPCDGWDAILEEPSCGLS